MMQRLFYFICLCACGVAIASVPQRTIYIGLASNFSDVANNTYNAFGHSVRNGARLALDEENVRLSKSGIHLVLKEIDYGGKVISIPSRIDAASKSDLIAVVGYEFSDEALLAAPLHHELKFPMLTPSASADRLSTIGSYVHEGAFSNSYQGEALARFALTRLKARRVAIISAADCAYCSDFAHAFEKKYTAIGGKITAEIPVLTDDTDFTQAISRLKASSYDAVFVPNQEVTSSRIISALLKDGVRKPFLGGDGWRTLGHFSGRPEAKYFHGYMTAQWVPEAGSAQSRAFVEQYVKRFGKVPTDSAALAYDSIHLMGEAIGKMKRYDRAALEVALNSINDFTGVTGAFVYHRPNRAPEKTVLIMRSTPNGFTVGESLAP